MDDLIIGILDELITKEFPNSIFSRPPSKLILKYGSGNEYGLISLTCRNGKIIIFAHGYKPIITIPISDPNFNDDIIHHLKKMTRMVTNGTSYD